MEHNERIGQQTGAWQDVFSSQWKQMRGTLRSWWGKLTDDDWERIAGHKDRLIGMLQEKYGYTKDMAQREMERRFGEYSGQEQSYSMRQTAAGVSQKAGEMYEDAKAKAQEYGSAAAEKVSGASTAMAEKMSSAAQSLRSNAPKEGMMGSAASSVADGLDAAGSYLQEKDFNHMAQDVTDLIRRYPVQSLLIGVGIGYLFSRSSRR
jgi:uncharacterized protein YjbJ (UPF0337 family)